MRNWKPQMSGNRLKNVSLNLHLSIKLIILFEVCRISLELEQYFKAINR
jgi:hypothetical protein